MNSPNRLSIISFQLIENRRYPFREVGVSSSLPIQYLFPACGTFRSKIVRIDSYPSISSNNIAIITASNMLGIGTSLEGGNSVQVLYRWCLGASEALLGV